MPYLLDSNVFIEAKNLHYGLDKVGDELEAGADELATWATERGPEFFVKPDAAVVPALGQVSGWVTEQGYEPAAINTFLQVADYYLVSHALAHGHTVVTHEKPKATTRKIQIPNVCIGFGIKCMTPFDMLRHERARFVLDH
jgi:hypothetical protein